MSSAPRRSRLNPSSRRSTENVQTRRRQAAGGLPSLEGSDYVPGDNAFGSLPSLSDKFQVDAFNKAVNKAASGGGVLGMLRRRSTKGGSPGGNGGGNDSPSRDAPYTVEDMLTHSTTPVATSLLKLSSESVAKSVKMSPAVIRLVTDDTIPAAELAATLQKLVKETVKRPELRDELFLMVLRTTRCNDALGSAIKAWELMHLTAAVVAPSRDFLGFASEYINECANADKNPPAVRAAALRALGALKRSAKAGPRRHPPMAEEIEALRSERMLSTIVFFLDETFEELPYDCMTTVGEAVESLAGIIRLQQFQTFSLFESRKQLLIKANAAAKDDAAAEESVILQEGTLISDVLQDFRVAKAEKKEAVQMRLVFKKRMFRDTDENITEPVFINLSYLQAKHDFLGGNYPVNKDDAVQLAAFQIQAEEGASLGQGAIETLAGAMTRFIPRYIVQQRPREDWATDTQSRHRALMQHSKEEARLGLLRMIRSLPYGGSIFFPVKRIEDPIGLLPGKIILGINKRGIHFFRPTPMEYLHSAELRDIMQFGSSSAAVFFKMRVAGQLHIFQFDTKQGEDICIALQTHINDVMMKRYNAQKQKQSTTAAAAAPASNGLPPPASASALPSAAAQAASDAAFTKQAASGGAVGSAVSSQMQKVLEDANRKLDQMVRERSELQVQLKAAQEHAQESADRAAHCTASNADLSAAVERLNAELADTKGHLADAEARATAAAQGVAASESDASAKLTAQVKELTKSLAAEAEKARAADGARTAAENDKSLLEQKLARMEQSTKDEAVKRESAAAKEVEQLKALVAAAEGRALSAGAELDDANARIEEMRAEHEAASKDLEELEALREMKADVERKEKYTADIIKNQSAAIAELEKKYQEESTLRKRYFNQMEDMKGKIRVYARTRPLTKKETDEGQKFSLSFPDEFTLEHPWKEEKKNRSYAFDTVFGANTEQEKVFEDTKYLVQSAFDGYNVCIFAYGQTGSGKTFTIYGNDELPGLTPRAIGEVMRIVYEGANKGKFSVKMEAYMLELYQDSINDLLLPPEKLKTPPKLDIKKDAKGWVTVTNSTIVPVASEEEIMGVIEAGLSVRKVTSTKMNVESSRSHLIFSLVIETTDLQTQAVTRGKLSFVDLAGSERLKKSGATGDTMKEAQAINKSLSALGNVISALATEQAHIPYRDHKLTMLMSDSLGGNAKTLMFVNVSPTDGNLEETQNSLTYATRVRTIKNDATKNTANREMVRLKAALAMWRARAGELEGETQEIEDRVQGEMGAGDAPGQAMAESAAKLWAGKSRE